MAPVPEVIRKATLRKLAAQAARRRRLSALFGGK
jgi:hypothetical protein